MMMVIIIVSLGSMVIFFALIAEMASGSRNKCVRTSAHSRLRSLKEVTPWKFVFAYYARWST